MASEFEVGDKVRYKEGRGSSTIYTIEEKYQHADEIIYIFANTKGLMNRNGWHLELVEKAPKEIPKKYNNGKPMMSLIRPEFINAVAEVLTYGFEKYDEKRGDIQNYLKGDGFHYSEIYDSLQRHLNEWFKGNSIDPETNCNHLAHAAANIMFLLTYELTGKGVDDRIVLEGVAIETETTEKITEKRSEGRHDTEIKESDRSSEGSDQATKEAT